jgi:hypothetical protein
MMHEPIRGATGERGAVSVGFVVVIVLLVVGLVAAFVGVTTAVDKVQENEQLTDYSNARSRADVVLTTGKRVVTAGQELCNCSAQERDVVYQMIDAALANDADRYNALRDQYNQLADQHNDLLGQLP